MSTRRFISSAGAVALAALALTACTTGSETPEESKSAGSEKTVDKILFDYPYTALPVYAVLQNNVTAYAEKQGIDVEFTNDNMDLSTQVSQLTTYVSSDVDAVVSFPMDNASLESVAKQYLDADKYWVTYGGDMETQSTSLQFSFTESGRMLGEDAGKWANDTLGGSGKVLLLGDQTIQLGQERTKGILDALEETSPDLEVIEQQAVTPDEGLSVTTAALAQDPDIALVLASSGDAAAGAYQALLGAGRSADDAKTYVGGLDGNLSLFQEMQKGNMVRGVVTVNSDELAQAVIDVPVSLGKGESQDTFDVPVYLVTPDSDDLDDYVTSFGG